MTDISMITFKKEIILIEFKLVPSNKIFPSDGVISK